nr:hypothetical protein GCM10017745_02980 [Saccharothrix mutabilis subsp. capreolus]
MALALGAAAVLVLSDNARWLRLAVVAALWAALTGAFLAARYRRQVADRDDEVADLQSVYELELEREVAARREYELELEAETRRRVREESREDLEALRNELRVLRENLEALLGGEVLVERVALRAESTRMRALSDQSRLMAVGDQRIITAGPAKAVAAKAEKPAPDRTELIERVPHDGSRKDQARRPEPTRPEPARRDQPQPARREPLRTTPQRPAAARAESTERVNRADLAGRLTPNTPQPPRRPEPRPAAPAAAQHGEPVRGETRRQTEGVALDAGRLGIGLTAEPAAPAGAPAPAGAGAGSGERRGRAAERTEMISRDAVAADQATRRPTEPVSRPADSRATADTRAVDPRAAGSRAADPRVAEARAAESRVAESSRSAESRSVEPAGRRADQTGGFRTVAASSVRQTETSARQTGSFPAVASRGTEPGGRRAAAEGSGFGAHESTVDAGLARPTAVRRAAEMTGGFRPVENAGQAETKGRRAAATGAGFRPVTPATTRRAADHTGSYEPVSAEPAARSSAEVSGRRRAPEPVAPEPAGAHADGKSVSELLAAFGGADSPRRRRRRGED